MELLNMIDFVTWLSLNLKTTDENALNQWCWSHTQKYAMFLNTDIEMSMIKGDNRFFTDEAKYHDLQPSTQWNYTEINGYRVFEATNTNPHAYLGKKIKDLTHLGLKLTPIGYEYLDQMKP